MLLIKITIRVGLLSEALTASLHRLEKDYDLSTFYAKTFFVLPCMHADSADAVVAFSAHACISSINYAFDKSEISEAKTFLLSTPKESFLERKRWENTT